MRRDEMIDDLIARLSAGERWDGDNAEVLKALGWSVDGDVVQKPDGVGFHRMMHSLNSVDDALRLVPNEWHVLYISQNAAKTKWWCRLVPTNDADDAKVVTGHASTAAIALTIAILETSRG